MCAGASRGGGEDVVGAYLWPILAYRSRSGDAVTPDHEGGEVVGRAWGRFVRAGGEAAPPDDVRTAGTRGKYIAPIKIQRRSKRCA